MPVAEIVDNIFPAVTFFLLLIGLFFSGRGIGRYEGREEAKKGQKLVFVVLHEDGTVSAVTQEGKRISFVTECEVKTAEVPYAHD